MYTTPPGLTVDVHNPSHIDDLGDEIGSSSFAPRPMLSAVPSSSAAGRSRPTTIGESEGEASRPGCPQDHTEVGTSGAWLMTGVTCTSGNCVVLFTRLCVGHTLLVLEDV